MTTRAKNSKIAEMRGPVNGLILDHMRKYGIATLRDFADTVGISRNTIYDLVRGRSTINGAWMKPSLDTLSKLATALNRPAHELLYLIDPEAPGAGTPLAQDVTQVSVQIAGHAGAGPDQDREAHDHTYVERSFADGRDLVAFRIAGDSMAGGSHPIYRNDLVIVDRNVRPEINGAVVARLNGNGYVCKRLRPGNILDSANPDFLDPEQAVITPDRIDQLVGRVIRIVHTTV